MVNKTSKFLKRFMVNRKGTAEVIGSVLFIIILMFAFSNIYLWHDNATKTMNTLLSDKLNSQITVHWKLDSVTQQETDTLVVTNTGGVGTKLVRLWVVTNAGEHQHFELGDLYLSAGNTREIDISEPPVSYNKVDGKTFTVLTSLGNMASPRGQIIIVDNGGNGGGGNGNAPIGSIIVANFDTFTYYTATEQAHAPKKLNLPGSSGYDITPSSNVPVAFSVTLTNEDSLKRTAVLNSNTEMFFLDTKNPSHVGYVKFYIVNVDSAGNIATSFTSYDPSHTDRDYTLVYGESVTVYFASSSPVPDSLHSQYLTDQKGDTYALNLALLGTIGGNPLGQNVPFVSMSVR